ncbi:MAG: FkbM family methyltransferase [Spirochaetia bacterium]
MNSRDPYAYLKSLCSNEADIKHIDEIAARRSRIMKGESQDGAAAGSENETAPASLRPLHASLRPLHLGGFTFYLEKDIAPSSIDTLVEIFQQRSHRRLPGFSGVVPPTRLGSGKGSGNYKRPGAGVVIDLGANEGFYSLAMLMENPSLRIIAVEPNPQVYNILCKNVSANVNIAKEGGNITPVHTAVTEKEGTMLLQSYPHLSTISSRDIGIMGQSWIEESRIQSHRVPATTLPRLISDYNIDHADILKIDVEGDELAVLEGVEKIEGLKRFEGIDKSLEPQAFWDRIDRIVVEWHRKDLKDECISFLTTRGFSLVHEETHRFGDLYFERDSRF